MHPQRLATLSRTLPDGLRHPDGGEPFYLPVGNEIAVFGECHRRGLAVHLKGPTGCGKTRFVERVAWRLKRPLVTVACHDDLHFSGSDRAAGWTAGRRNRVAGWSPRTRGATGGDLLPRRGGRGPPGCDRRDSPTYRRSPNAADRKDRRAGRGCAGVSSWSSPTIPVTSTCSRISSRARGSDLWPSNSISLPRADLEHRVVHAPGGVDNTTAGALVELAGRIRRLRAGGSPPCPAVGSSWRRPGSSAVASPRPSLAGLPSWRRSLMTPICSLLSTT